MTSMLSNLITSNLNEFGKDLQKKIKNKAANRKIEAKQNRNLKLIRYSSP